VIDLRIIAPGPIPSPVLEFLRSDPRVAHVVLLSGTALPPQSDPPGEAGGRIEPSDRGGDTLMCLVAREAATEVIERSRQLGLDHAAGILIEEVAAIDSAAATRAEQAAPGAPDDAIVWDVVVRRAAADARASWSYFTFLALATTIAAIAVITDSPILVVGAMVVGPEFGPVSAITVGLVLRRRGLLLHALRLLVAGFVVAIAATTVLALVARAGGWITAADVLSSRPLTGFIWKPDRWSVAVALLAGAAGVLSLTAGRSNALVGVFISVTTVPAAGNLALALAFIGSDKMRAEIVGAAEQLGVNLTGMVIAGALVLALQRALTAPNRRRTSVRS
jgi:uncharacterized hydrophobic protein (TIGR00271 family)